MRQKPVATKAKPRAHRPRDTPRGHSPRDEGGQITLSVGQATRTASGSFGFVGVTEDSRCPTGVQCVWAGQVVVSMWAAPRGSSGPRGATRFSLTLGAVQRAGEPDLATKAVQGRRFKLLAVEPYPAYKRPIDPSSYVITVQVDDLAQADAQRRRPH
jgi:hypothetical protein